MLAFIALTYYMGIVKKDLITSYWRINSTIALCFLEWSCLEMSLKIFLPFLIAVTRIPPKILKYWVGAQPGQSYPMGRRCLFSHGWPPF